MKSEQNEMRSIKVYSEKTGELMSITEETTETESWRSGLTGDDANDPLVGWMHGGWQKDSSW